MNSTLDAVKEQPTTSPHTAKRMAKPVNFYCHTAPNIKSVRLVGSFNDWDITSLPMQRQPHGWWSAQVPLTHGHHQYVFLVDGEPKPDPHADRLVRVDTYGEVSLIAVS